MKNPLRAWLRAHLNRPLDDIYGRIDQHGVDDAGRRPTPVEPDLIPARARHHRPRHHRGAGRMAH